MVESQSPNNPAPGLSPLRGTFVGRQREMSELKAGLEDAMSGHGRLVMLGGELSLPGSFPQSHAHPFRCAPAFLARYPGPYEEHQLLSQVLVDGVDSNPTLF